MLRLPPTTLSLTMAEVKDFEQRRRFKKYLSENKTFVNQLPLAPRIAGSPQPDRGDRRPGTGTDSQDNVDARCFPALTTPLLPPDEKKESSPLAKAMIISSRTHTPTERSEASAGDGDGAGAGGDSSVKGGCSKSNSNSQSSLQTAGSGSSAQPTQQESTPGRRPPALPRPFSVDTRTVSDTQSLPSVCAWRSPVHLRVRSMFCSDYE